MRAVLIFGVALIVAGWIWQTHNALGTEGWKELKASLARDPAFALSAPGHSWFSSR